MPSIPVVCFHVPLTKKWTTCVEKLLIHQGNAVLQNIKRALGLSEEPAAVHLWTNGYLNERLTHEPRSTRAAVLQLGHLGELIGEENVLGNHWDLRRSILLT